MKEIKEKIEDWTIEELLRKDQPLHLRIKYWLKLNDLVEEYYEKVRFNPLNQ